MNVFCQQCASKPGWEFKEEYVVMRSCMRCMQHKRCNHYVDKKPVHESVSVASHGPAPQPKDLVKEQVNVHAEVNLPRATGLGEMPTTPQPAAVPVAPPTPSPVTPEKAGNDVDKMLDTVQPNRPGIKLETKKKNG